jgi:magnesium chelatase family protein
MAATSEPPRYADLVDVKDQAGVKRGLEIAAGGHSLLMQGLHTEPSSRSAFNGSPP